MTHTCASQPYRAWKLTAQLGLPGRHVKKTGHSWPISKLCAGAKNWDLYICNTYICISVSGSSWTFQPDKSPQNRTVRFKTGILATLCATLNGFLKPDMPKQPWTRALFSRQKLLDILVSVIWSVNFWTAPTAWFHDRTGQDLEHSPCPSVISYCCSEEGFYLTVLSTGYLLENHCKGPEHRTTIFSAVLHVMLDRADNAQTLI